MIHYAGRSHASRSMYVNTLSMFLFSITRCVENGELRKPRTLPSPALHPQKPFTTPVTLPPPPRYSSIGQHPITSDLSFFLSRDVDNTRRPAFGTPKETATPDPKTTKVRLPLSFIPKYGAIVNSAFLEELASRHRHHQQYFRNTE